MIYVHLTIMHFLYIHSKKGAYIVRIEPLLHANAIVWGLGTSVASLALTVRKYSQSNLFFRDMLLSLSLSEPP